MTRLRLVRWVLPIGLCAIGVVMLLVALIRQDDIWGEGGALILSAGLSVWLLNVLHRVGVRGDTERDREAAARRYFDEHGRWPDDGPGGNPPRDG
jgi:uncharacterized membrane protein